MPRNLSTGPLPAPVLTLLLGGGLLAMLDLGSTLAAYGASLVLALLLVVLSGRWVILEPVMIPGLASRSASPRVMLRAKQEPR